MFCWYFGRERERKEAEFAKDVGFHHIFRMMVDSKKPLVGHNLLFDLMFMMTAFDGMP